MGSFVLERHRLAPLLHHGPHLVLFVLPQLMQDKKTQIANREFQLSWQKSPSAGSEGRELAPSLLPDAQGTPPLLQRMLKGQYRAGEKVYKYKRSISTSSSRGTHGNIVLEKIKVNYHRKSFW